MAAAERLNLILDFSSPIFDQTSNMEGWSIGPRGLHSVFTYTVPAPLRARLPPVLEPFPMPVRTGRPSRPDHRPYPPGQQIATSDRTLRVRSGTNLCKPVRTVIWV